jgi:hypothetical protein
LAAGDVSLFFSATATHTAGSSVTQLTVVDQANQNSVTVTLLGDYAADNRIFIPPKQLTRLGEVKLVPRTPVECFARKDRDGYASPPRYPSLSAFS